MPNAPWKCSQCGTVNEPAATSCRGCGRWPSLFDLQESAIGEDDQAVADEPEYEVEQYEPATVDEIDDVGEAIPTSTEQATQQTPSRRRSRSPAQRLVRLVIPIGFLLYFLISSYLRSH